MSNPHITKSRTVRHPLYVTQYEGHGATYEVFLPRKIEPESNRVLRLNYQFAGNTGVGGIC